MRIAGKEIKIIYNKAGKDVSAPYSPPNKDEWMVSIKKNGVTDLIIIFSDFKKAKYFCSLKADEIEIIKLPIINDSGKSIDEVHFFTKHDMDFYVDTMYSDDITSIDKIVEEARDDREDKMNSSFVDDNSLFADDDPDVEEFKTKWRDLNVKTEQDVKNLLISISVFYLEDEVLDGDYLRYLMNVKQKVLSAMLFTIESSKMSIENISRAIYIGNASAKDHDALGSQQRILLDNVKYLSDFIKSTVSEFKDMEARKEAIKSKKLDEGEVTDAILVSTPNRKELQKKLREMRESGIAADEDGEFDDEFIDDETKK